MKIDWTAMEKNGPARLVSSLRNRLQKGESFRITPAQLATEAQCTEPEARSALTTLETQGVLGKETQSECRCGHILSPTELDNEVCAECNSAFTDYSPPSPVHTEIYSFEGSETRDVRWVLVLHGMNTRGAWQEEFSWLLSRMYGYSVPVAIYKYGIVRPGVLFRFRLKALTTKLLEKIAVLSREAGSGGFGGTPDVVAHSLGTWLIGHALQADEKLRVGRIILLGSILRPDFDWGVLVNRSQVEAVMCHRATGDIPVAIAQYIIPDSGPSGRRGFNSGVVNEVVSEGLAHSAFFSEDRMRSFYTDSWKPFLTSQRTTLENQHGEVKAWRPTNWLFRALLLRYMIILLLLILLCLLFIILGLGFSRLLSWIV